MALFVYILNFYLLIDNYLKYSSYYIYNCFRRVIFLYVLCSINMFYVYLKYFFYFISFHFESYIRKPQKNNLKYYTIQK